jgi:hypothetical protein
MSMYHIVYKSAIATDSKSGFLSQSLAINRTCICGRWRRSPKSAKPVEFRQKGTLSLRAICSSVETLADGVFR